MLASVGLLLGLGTPALADGPGPGRTAAPASGVPAPDDEDDEFVTRTHGRIPLHGPTQGRASSKVTRRDMALRLPRSAPDALRYEPGVTIQQTAHGQASAYIRGRTGQQTLLLFDGVRLNTSTFRQGPNQYFFTVDARSIDSIEVLRGGASTLFGSDAIAGVILTHPLEPTVLPGHRGWRLSPGASMRFASADSEGGGRIQLEAQAGSRAAFLGGVGYRSVGLLRSGGPVLSPATGEAARVPRFDDDGVTQLGTSFHELASDARLLIFATPRLRLTGALYDYRQLDAPRTDQCPPAYAPLSHCLTYEEQFRTLGTLALDADLGRAGLGRVVVSYQNQHERRRFDRPDSYTVNGGRDDVHTLGLAARLETRPLRPMEPLSLTLRTGGEFYYDLIDSSAWTEFTDFEVVVPATRGQYLAGSTYASGGLFAQVEAALWNRLVLRAGGRLAGAAARAPGDPESGTAEVDRDWLTGVGQVGAELRLVDGAALLFNLDRSFRTPNLDDLTSRQQTGPGFQFENPDLQPEAGLGLEVGARLDLTWLQLDAWFFYTTLDDAIERAPRTASECPKDTPQCQASWSRFQLVNLPEPAILYGAEGALRAFLPLGLSLRATLAYAFGYGPDPRGPSAGAASAETLPLSRVPPLNGTVELRFQGTLGLHAGAGLRWALAQDRLSLGDLGDARIPVGGTPGYAVLDLRAGYRLSRRVFISAVLENLLNAAYRVHGSSVNGPGRGIIVSVGGQL